MRANASCLHFKDCGTACSTSMLAESSVHVNSMPLIRQLQHSSTSCSARKDNNRLLCTQVAQVYAP